MEGSEQGAVGTEHHVVADGDRTGVENREIEVGVAPGPERREDAVVHVDRPGQKQIGALVRKEFVQNLPAPGRRLIQGIVFPPEPMRFLTQGGKLPVGRVVEHPPEHFFQFSHSVFHLQPLIFKLYHISAADATGNPHLGSPFRIE